MATKAAPKKATKDDGAITVKQHHIDGIDESMTHSEKWAVLATQSTLSAVTLQQYAGAGDKLELTDLIAEMKKKADAVVGGNMSMVERMLVNQAMTLDAMFNNLAQRAIKQETFKGIEVLTRLAMKAQAQARSTAEALALVKNPMPYIRQANITNGPQQVNNGNASASGHTGISTQPSAHQNTAIANEGASGFTGMTSQIPSHQKALVPARGQFLE